MPELRTSGSASGFWRSPAAQEPGITIARLETKTGEPVGSMCRHYDKHTGRMAQIGLTQQVQARLAQGQKKDGYAMPAQMKFSTDAFALKGNGNVETAENGLTHSITSIQTVASIADQEMFLTPSANEDAAGRPGSKMQKMLGNCESVRGTTSAEWERGTLNPTWVEWLMGWPLGWTDLNPLETDKFQQWLRSHGKFSPANNYYQVDSP